MEIDGVSSPLNPVPVVFRSVKQRHYNLRVTCSKIVAYGGGYCASLVGDPYNEVFRDTASRLLLTKPNSNCITLTSIEPQVIFFNCRWMTVHRNESPFASVQASSPTGAYCNGYRLQDLLHHVIYQLGSIAIPRTWDCDNSDPVFFLTTPQRDK